MRKLYIHSSKTVDAAIVCFKDTMHIHADATTMHAKSAPHVTVRAGKRLVCNIEKLLEDGIKRSKGRKRSANSSWKMLVK